MRTVVYKAIFGNIDKLENIDFECDSDVDYVCFTDDKKLTLATKKWEIVVIKNKSLNTRDYNRMLKFMPHKWFSDYIMSVYLDGNVKLKRCIGKFAMEELKSRDWVSPKHRYSSSLADEANLCLDLKKINRDEFMRYMVSHQNQFKPGPFPENGIILRRHNQENVKELGELWWNLYKNGIKRDQLHWQIAFNSSDVHFGYLKYDFATENSYFELAKHRFYWLTQLKRQLFKLLNL